MFKSHSATVIPLDCAPRLGKQMIASRMDHRVSHDNQHMSKKMIR